MQDVLFKKYASFYTSCLLQQRTHTYSSGQKYPAPSISTQELWNHFENFLAYFASQILIPCKISARSGISSKSFKIPKFHMKHMKTGWSFSNINFKNSFLCRRLMNLRDLFFISFVWSVSKLCQSSQLNYVATVTFMEIIGWHKISDKPKMRAFFFLR